MNERKKGIVASLSSALLLGLTPIFGKQSMLLGFSPLAVVAIRSTIAALLLLLFLFLFRKSFFYIYPLGLAGCLIAGFVNGVGSIFYYTALSRLDTSIGQLLYSFYPLFVALWLIADRQSVSRITVLRLLIIIPGVFTDLQLAKRYRLDRCSHDGNCFASVCAAPHHQPEGLV
jgi:drug/metabolite transporter (DMT)-like permease